MKIFLAAITYQSLPTTVQSHQKPKTSSEKTTNTTKLYQKQSPNTHPKPQRSSPSLFPFLFPVKSFESSQQSDPNDLFRVQLLHRQSQSSRTPAAAPTRNSLANHRKQPIHPSSFGHLLRSDLTGFMIFRRCSSSTTSDNGSNKT
ncbi:hypothetical protein H5410_022958 [Solanum commersonii]|uniref:Uncharacterized protein n=1 Tax=Solanum commersonii TaxID=4109 RepID=A0A9J5ZGX1_SOLCO|nr:hypothetical protein H5410_022958 [Solanum commersonii]